MTGWKTCQRWWWNYNISDILKVKRFLRVRSMVLKRPATSYLFLKLRREYTTRSWLCFTMIYIDPKRPFAPLDVSWTLKSHLEKIWITCYVVEDLLWLESENTTSANQWLRQCGGSAAHWAHVTLRHVCDVSSNLHRRPAHNLLLTTTALLLAGWYPLSFKCEPKYGIYYLPISTHSSISISA